MVVFDLRHRPVARDALDVKTINFWTRGSMFEVVRCCIGCPTHLNMLHWPIVWDDRVFWHAEFFGTLRLLPRSAATTGLNIHSPVIPSSVSWYQL
jgi:hypothetical protein